MVVGGRDLVRRWRPATAWGGGGGRRDPFGGIGSVGLSRGGGFPEGWFKGWRVFGGAEGAPWAAQEGWERLPFRVWTGAAKLFWKAAPRNLKKWTRDLVGRALRGFSWLPTPGLVGGAANAIFFNHGQCCVAGSRLYVEQDRFDEVVQGVAEIAMAIKVGDGFSADTQMGPPYRTSSCVV